MSCYDIVSDIKILLSKLDGLHNGVDRYDLKEILRDGLSGEIRTHCTEWMGKVRKDFEKYFIKQANIRVLREAEQEL